MSTDFYDQMSLKWRTDAYNRTIEEDEQMQQRIEPLTTDMEEAIVNARQKQRDEVISQKRVETLGDILRKAIQEEGLSEEPQQPAPKHSMIVGLPEVRKEVKINKKDAVGATKASTDCIPSAAIFALGAAMADGGKKYDPFNYRDSQVKASVFHNAMNRHHWDWWEGEDYAPDSLVHHLGHLMACCAIILDAISVGNFVDDRPNTRIEGASRRTQVWLKPKSEE